jgi:hypothetical protein
MRQIDVFSVRLKMVVARRDPAECDLGFLGIEAHLPFKT